VKRFLVTVAALAALSLVSSACNVTSSSSAVATVQSNGTTTAVTTGQLNSTMAALARDSGFLCIGGLTTGATSRTVGAGVGTYDLHYAEAVLTQLVKFAVTHQIVTSLHLATPSSDMTLAGQQVESGAAAQLESTSESGSTCKGTAQSIINGLGTSFRDAFDTEQLEEDAVDAHLAGTSLQPGALASYEQAHVVSTTESCTSVIEVTTRKLAQQLYGQIRAGAKFATVANAHKGQGTGAGGAIGCPLKSQWVAALGSKVVALKVGQVSQPVSFNGHWLLLLVTSRKLEPAAGMLAQLATTEQTAFQKLYGQALQHSKIAVAPIYGAWASTVSSAGIQVAITPPPDRASKFAPNENAVLGAAA
jgi:hypothetical protein